MAKKIKVEILADNSIFRSKVETIQAVEVNGEIVGKIILGKAAPFVHMSIHNYKNKEVKNYVGENWTFAEARKNAKAYFQQALAEQA